MEDDEASRISSLSSAPSSSAAMYSLASRDEACCEEKARVGEVSGKGSRCARVRLNRSNTRDGNYGRSATLSSWKCDHPAECSEGSEG